MSITRLTTLLACLSMVLSVQPAAAVEAYFTDDGETVVLAPCGTSSGLVQVDVASGELTHAPLPPELKDECIESIAEGSEGEILFLAKDAVWAWTSDKKTPVKRICSTAPVVGATGLFVATLPDTPFTDCLFVSGMDKDNEGGGARFFGRKPGGKAFIPFFCRAVDDAQGGVFSEDGRLFFTSNRDVWEGGFQMEEDASMERLGTLVAARVAPLAARTTDEIGGGLGVVNIAVAGKWLYLQLQGKHEAALLRTPLTAKPLYAPGQGEEAYPSLKEQYTTMAKALGKAEVINDELERVNGFCATEVNGKPRVFYHDPALTDKGSALMLWEGEGKPRVIGYLPAE